MSYILLKDKNNRKNLIEYLKSKGIYATFHYVPLHLSPVGMNLGYKKGTLPVTEDMSDKLLRLPFYNDITEQNQEVVVLEIKSFFEQQN